MNRPFLIPVGYKLSTAEYSNLVDKIAEILPNVRENRQSMQGRFSSLLESTTNTSVPLFAHFLRLPCRDAQSYSLPTKRESDLILAYSKLIVKTNGR